MFVRPQQQVRQALGQALGTAFGADPTWADALPVQATAAPHTGHYTVVVFGLSRHRLGAPEAVGQRLGEALLQLYPEDVAAFEVVKGFLNLSFHDAWWDRQLEALLQHPPLVRLPETGRTQMVEFCSPNTNKPIHLGHLRNIFLGDSLSRMLHCLGHRVVKANLVNDRGVHICKSMLAYRLAGATERPRPEGPLKGDHMVGKYYVDFSTRLEAEVNALVQQQGMSPEEAERQASLTHQVNAMLLDWEAGQPAVMELWHQMNAWVMAGFEETFRRLGIEFDLVQLESQTYQLGKALVQEGLQAGVFYRKPDGSIWVNLEDKGLDHKLLLRANGTSVYITQDLGTAQRRFEDYDLDTLYYVVGNEQDYHFQVLKAILEKLGRNWAQRIHHVSYGMVELPEGKMKSRKGNVVDADDLLDSMLEHARSSTAELGKIEGLDEAGVNNLHRQIALGALKYHLLKVEPTRMMLFNPKESIDFQGHTGVFLQYGHARLCSLLAKAQAQPAPNNPDPSPLHPTERELLQHLLGVQESLENAVANLNPSILANHLHELCRALGSFLSACPVLKAPSRAAFERRTRLAGAVRDALARGLDLLGIEAPQRM